jgi:hypothetical protein
MHAIFSRRAEYRAGWVKHKTSDEWWRSSLIPPSKTRPASQKPPTITNAEESIGGIDIPGDPIADTAGTANLLCKDMLITQRNVVHVLGLATGQDAIVAP